MRRCWTRAQPKRSSSWRETRLTGGKPTTPQPATSLQSSCASIQRTQATVSTRIDLTLVSLICCCMHPPSPQPLSQVRTRVDTGRKLERRAAARPAHQLARARRATGGARGNQVGCVLRGRKHGRGQAGLGRAGADWRESHGECDGYSEDEDGEEAEEEKAEKLDLPPPGARRPAVEGR